MKALGALLIVVGALGIAAAVAFALLPPESAPACGNFLLLLVSGASPSASCVAAFYTAAWLVPVTGLGGVVLLLIGVLFVQGSRMREISRTLAYTRTSKGLTSPRTTTLSGNGVPVSVTSGVTSGSQSEYAQRAGYSRAASTPVPSAQPGYAAPASSEQQGFTMPGEPQQHPGSVPTQQTPPPGAFVQPGTSYLPSSGQ